MKHLRLIVRLLCVLSLALGAPTLAFADEFTTIDAPAPATKAYGINPRGDIVGGAPPFGAGSIPLRGFLLSEGTFTIIHPPGAGPRDTEAVGINPQGDIVGYYADSSGKAHGYLLSKGRSNTIDDVPGATHTVPQGINARGDIVGLYVDSSSKVRGFLLGRGTFTRIDVPGATFTRAFGINPQGDGESLLAETRFV